MLQLRGKFFRLSRTRRPSSFGPDRGIKQDFADETRGNRIQRSPNPGPRSPPREAISRAPGEVFFPIDLPENPFRSDAGWSSLDGANSRRSIGLRVANRIVEISNEITLMHAGPVTLFLKKCLRNGESFQSIFKR